jgi:type VI secretion system protein ImpK
MSGSGEGRETEGWKKGMAEESKPFDPDATVRQPAAAIDPDVTPVGPLKMDAGDDPEATVTGAAAFDPEATFNPAQRAMLEDPEATVRIPSPGRRQKRNPFAPHARADALQANLSALGGLNPLIAIANPVLGAVPQIRRALRHPNPQLLRKQLREQLESFQTSATSADIPGRTVEWAVYALCALLDESAASTPWGAEWSDQGLLRDLRDEAGAAEGFFALLERLTSDPEENVELIEFFYVCMALGFEGRHRGPEGRHELTRVRDRIYSLISRRRPRPRDGLSEHWRSPLDPLAVQAADRAVPSPALLAPVERVRAMPLRAKLSIGGALLGTLLVGWLVAMRFADDPKSELRHTPVAPQPAEPQQAQQPAAPAVAQGSDLPRELGDAALVSQKDGIVRIELRHDRQFATGAVRPDAGLRPLIERIARALDRAPGAIVVTGHADGTPARSGGNQALSLARARSVAALIAGGLADPKRVRAEGKGDAEPLVPNDSDANRAKNRRVVIEVRKAP